ncbi:MAG: DUF4160 domain-containing protein [Hyphomicrobiaceae bacterium]
MPTISIFFGITIRMYYRDHAPPHFHAVYAEHEAQVSIATGEIIEEKQSRVAVRLVREWCELHRHDLMENWRKREDGMPFERIPGLDAVQGD